MTHDPELHSWAVFGERGSGTKWIRRLIGRHAVRSEDLTNGHITRWKHSIWGSWQEEGISRQTLVVVVKKDIFAWLLSMHRKPWHMPHSEGLPFRGFIRQEYYSMCNGPMLQLWTGLGPQDELIERKDGKRWPNLVQMWVSKYRAWEAIDATRFSVLHLDYRQALRDPAQVIECVGRRNLMVRPFQGVAAYPKRNHYLEKKYLQQWRAEDIEFVIEELEKSDALDLQDVSGVRIG